MLCVGYEYEGWSRWIYSDPQILAQKISETSPQKPPQKIWIRLELGNALITSQRGRWYLHLVKVTARFDNGKCANHAHKQRQEWARNVTRSGEPV